MGKAKTTARKQRKERKNRMKKVHSLPAACYSRPRSLLHPSDSSAQGPTILPPHSAASLFPQIRGIKKSKVGS